MSDKWDANEDLEQGGRDSVNGSGQLRGPAAPLFCAVCLADGLPDGLALIGDEEVLYADEDGCPVCEGCGFERGFLPMLRQTCPPK